MLQLNLTSRPAPLRLLCLGAHSDDIEIGIGGTILDWIDRGFVGEVHWVVFSACQERRDEASKSAEAFLEKVGRKKVSLFEFRDGYFPNQSAEIKDCFEQLKGDTTPDVVLTHRRDDAHQDHREIARLTWNSFRDHMILEYEIPKWDGDLGRPNLYHPLSEAVFDRKIALLHDHFATQRVKDWFDAETFRSLARLRGVECRAPERLAEAFLVSKAVLA
jgi:LmbE family N-acetylglucosaminyl deacetylase